MFKKSVIFLSEDRDFKMSLSNMCVMFVFVAVCFFFFSNLGPLSRFRLNLFYKVMY